MLLLVRPPAAAQTEPPEHHGRSKFVYVFPAAFAVSFLVLGFVFVRAALARTDDSARLRAAAAKVDRALQLRTGGRAPDMASYDSRSDSVSRRPQEATPAAKLRAPRALRLATD